MKFYLFLNICTVLYPSIHPSTYPRLINKKLTKSPVRFIVATSYLFLLFEAVCKLAKSLLLCIIKPLILYCITHLFDLPNPRYIIIYS